MPCNIAWHSNIGRIVEELKQSNQFENTLIVFISDNGGSIDVSLAVNAPLWGTKGTFYEGGIRVPPFTFGQQK